jgi:cytoskeletal protein CcmA (bactofilin family)
MDAVLDSGRARAISGGPPSRPGRSVTIAGEIVTSEDLVIEGHVNGSVSAPDRLVTVSATGSVRGRVFARTVVIEGAVQGDVTASALIDVAERARVEADLCSPAVAIAQGAFLVGKVDMRHADAASRVARYRAERR